MVSLVPSLTEAIAATDRTVLVGVTDWCTHPADLDVTRVRGTKNPDVRAIVDLAPDLVVANQEENRELDVRRLREAGIPVWVTRIETLDEAFTSMRRLFVDVLGWDVPGWLVDAETVWSVPPPAHAVRPRVAVAIWRDPWMVVGRDTFTGDLLERLGFTHVYAHADARYPHVDLASLDQGGLDQGGLDQGGLDQGGLDLVLLPDEPYEFSPEDGPEAFTHVPTTLVAGRLLTWYGPSLVEAREQLSRLVS